MKRLVFFSMLILVLTGVQGLSLNEDIDLNSETVDDTLEETVDEFEGDGSGAVDREKYILMIDRENYRPSALDQLGADIRYEYSIIDGVAVEVPEQALNGLSQLDFVESVEPDLVTSIPVIEASDSDEDTESYSGGEDIVISVLDTGIDDNHVDLQDQVLDHQDFTGSGPEDMHGHGTHVAGIASGTGEADSRHAGVAPETGLMNVKVLNDDGSGRVSDAIQGIDYSVENNADIIVMSLGVEIECDGSDSLSQAADNAVEEGIPTVVSAGNSGPDSQTITSPGCGHNVLTIGASDNGENVASFSSRGPTDDGRIKPDLVADGVNIYAAEAGTSSGYVSKSGTSMSAPYVGGSIALLMDEYNGGPEDYFTALTDTAYTLDEDGNSEGSGQINVSAALNYWDNGGDGSPSEDDEESLDSDEGRESAEEEENIDNVDEDYRIEHRDGKEYFVYEGETENGRKVELWVDSETGEVNVKTDWNRTLTDLVEKITAFISQLIEQIKNY